MSSQVSRATVELRSARAQLRLVVPGERRSERRFRAEPRRTLALRADRGARSSVCPVLRFRVATVLGGPGARFDAA